jgi:prevent-host-death family protein
MNTFSMTDFRRRFNEVVALVEKGELITVTRRGKPVIDIQPPQIKRTRPSSAQVDKSK